MPPISQKVQAWLHAALLLLLSIDLTVLPQILPAAWAVKVIATIGLLIGVLKAAIGLYAQRFNTNGTPQTLPYTRKIPAPPPRASSNGTQKIALLVIAGLLVSCTPALGQLVTIQGSDRISDSRVMLNNNFAWLNANKAGLSACPPGQVAWQSTTTGLVCVRVSYLSLADIPTAFPPGAHQHDASDLISGAVPLARGGTNQDTWIPSRCVQISSDGTRMESAGSPCGAGSGGMADPTTTRGDLIYRSAAGITRLPLGALGYVLGSDGNGPVWTRLTPADIGAAPLEFPVLFTANTISIGAGPHRTGNVAVPDIPASSAANPVGTGKLYFYLLPGDTQVRVGKGTGITSAGTLTAQGDDGPQTQVPDEATPIAECDVSANSVTGCIRTWGSGGRDIVRCEPGGGVTCTTVGGVTTLSADAVSANATQIQGRDVSATAPNDGEVLAWSAGDSAWKPTALTAGSGTFGITIDGGGSAITTGVKGDIAIPFACTITGWMLVLDQSGSIVIDLWKDSMANHPPTVADTIAGTGKPTVSVGPSACANALGTDDCAVFSGWGSTSVAAGDTIRFNVDSASTATRATLVVTYTK